MIALEHIVPGREKRSKEEATHMRVIEQCRCGQDLDVCVRGCCPRCGSLVPAV